LNEQSEIRESNSEFYSIVIPVSSGSSGLWPKDDEGIGMRVTEESSFILDERSAIRNLVKTLSHIMFLGLGSSALRG
jgi:hypothetical protein